MPSVLEVDYCKTLQNFFCIFLILLCVTMRQLDVTGDASAIIGLKNTPSCPATAEEWKKQAKIWKCESIKTIAKATLKYHCLLNHWRNETLEFCGEEKTIIGQYCPEFNQRGNRIQERWTTKCNDSDPPCPFKFKSSDVFNYPKCLKPQETIDIRDINVDSGDTNRNLKIAVPIIVFLVILIFSALVYFRYKQRGNNNRESRSTTEEENFITQKMKTQKEFVQDRRPVLMI